MEDQSIDYGKRVHWNDGDQLPDRYASCTSVEIFTPLAQANEWSFGGNAEQQAAAHITPDTTVDRGMVQNNSLSIQQEERRYLWKATDTIVQS
jgi:hypothetical protein